MPDLYAELGVPKTATKDHIRKAYRKKAKKAHPDAGGSAEKFALIRLAHDILMDDERRRKYDATGDEAEAAPDNSHSDIVNCMIFAQEHVLGAIERKGGNPVEFDIIKDMRTFLSDEIAKIDENTRQCGVRKKKIERLLGRFKTKREINYLEISVQGKLSACNEAIAANEKRRIPLDAARAWLKDYTFDFQSPKSYPQGDLSLYVPKSSDGVSMKMMLDVAMRGM